MRHLDRAGNAFNAVSTDNVHYHSNVFQESKMMDRQAEPGAMAGRRTKSVMAGGLADTSDVDEMKRLRYLARSDARWQRRWLDDFAEKELLLLFPFSCSACFYVSHLPNLVWKESNTHKRKERGEPTRGTNVKDEMNEESLTNRKIGKGKKRKKSTIKHLIALRDCYCLFKPNKQ